MPHRQLLFAESIRRVLEEPATKGVVVSRTVVVALDTSDLSARAFPFAQQIARDWRGPLVFVQARGLDLQFREIVWDRSAIGVNADFVLRSTPPAQAIIDVANEREADLIVMASQQRRGIVR